MLDLLGMIWDVFTDSAFMRWFLLGALIGLGLVIALYLRGMGLDAGDALLGIFGSGLAAVGARFVYWIVRR